MEYGEYMLIWTPKLSLSQPHAQLHFKHFQVQYGILLTVLIIVFICLAIPSWTSINPVHSCSCFREQTGSAAGWGMSSAPSSCPKATQCLLHSVLPAVLLYTRVWLILFLFQQYLTPSNMANIQRFQLNLLDMVEMPLKR